MKRRCALCAVGAALLILAPAPALAFALLRAPDGRSITWAAFPVAYSVGPGAIDREDRLREIRRGFEIWGYDARAAVALAYAGPVAARFDYQDGRNTVVVLDEGPWPPELGDVNLVAAVTLTRIDNGSARITETEVAINAITVRWAYGDAQVDAIDLWSVAAHEAGHVLGLAHACNAPGVPRCSVAGSEAIEATMFPTATPGDLLRRDPAADDLAGITALYGVGDIPAPDETLLFDPCLPALTLRGPGDVAPTRGLELSAVEVERGEIFALAPPDVSGEIDVFGLSEGRYDLVVRGPTGKARTHFAAFALPARCPEPQPPRPGAGPGTGPEGGCGCGPGGEPRSSWPPLLLALVLLAGRRLFGTRGLCSGRGCGLLLLLAVALPPGPAEACVRTRVVAGGPCLYWGTRTVPIHLNQNGSADITDGSDVEAVKRAVGHWTAEPCSDLALPFEGLTSRSNVGFSLIDPDNQNLIVWREKLCREVVPASDTCWACFDTGGECCGSRYGCWEHPRGVIAVTTTTFSRLTGGLVDADIELNGIDYWFTTLDTPSCNDPEPAPRCQRPADCLAEERCFDGSCLAQGCVRIDIENTITHEVGHIVGLEHSADLGATMYASAPEGELDKRSLEDDDRACFCATYPAGAPTVTCFGREVTFTPVRQRKNTRGCGCGTRGGGRAALALLVFGLLATTLMRWRFVGRGVLFACALLPLGAKAHLLSVPPDLDAWISRGEVVGVARAVNRPEPCGAKPYPAVQTIVFDTLLAGELASKQVEVLLPDEHAFVLSEHRPGPAVLERVSALGGCVRSPEWRAVTPAPALLEIEDVAEWSRYLSRVRALPARGPERREALRALWIRALSGRDRSLLAHATGRLAGQGVLPDAAAVALARVATDPEQDLAVRLRAIRMARARLDPSSLRALLGDPDLEIVEAVFEVLREGPPTTVQALAPQLDLFTRSSPGDRPREIILRSGAFAVLARTGGPRHRGSLVELLGHRLFKVRRWAVLGLGALARAGDARSRHLLELRRAREPDARIREVIDAELATLAAGSSGGQGAGGRGRDGDRAGARRARLDLGWRMLLVLLGLASLAFMLILPRIKRISASRGR